MLSGPERSRDLRIGLVVGVAMLSILALWAVLVLPQDQTTGPNVCGLCGASFAWGPASNVTSSFSSYPGCTPAKECYYLEIGSAGSGLDGRDITFTVNSSSETMMPTTGWTFTLISTQNSTLDAHWLGPGDCSGGACSSYLVSGENIAIDTGGSSSLLGDNVIAVLQGSYPGEVSTVGGLPQ
jgi:hypothetical protein